MSMHMICGWFLRNLFSEMWKHKLLQNKWNSPQIVFPYVTFTLLTFNTAHTASDECLPTVPISIRGVRRFTVLRNIETCTESSSSNTCTKCDTYEVEEVFPWKILTHVMISFFLEIEKFRKSIQIIGNTALNFWQWHLFLGNNTQREVDHWNQHR